MHVGNLLKIKINCIWSTKLEGDIKSLWLYRRVGGLYCISIILSTPGISLLPQCVDSSNNPKLVFRSYGKLGSLRTERGISLSYYAFQHSQSHWSSITSMSIRGQSHEIPPAPEVVFSSSQASSSMWYSTSKFNIALFITYLFYVSYSSMLYPNILPSCGPKFN